jgi:hypothetical protein
VIARKNAFLASPAIQTYLIPGNYSPANLARFTPAKVAKIRTAFPLAKQSQKAQVLQPRDGCVALLWGDGV